MFSRAVGASLPDRRHGSIEQRWMAIDRCLGPLGSSDPAEDVVARDDVVKHEDDFWRVVACFGKYYGRWALVTAPVPLTENYHLMLQLISVNKADKPYVHMNFCRTPWAIIIKAKAASAANHTLVAAADEAAKPKKLKPGADLWD